MRVMREGSQVESLTIIGDGNPSFDDANNYLDKCMEEEKVNGVQDGSASMAEPSLTVFVYPQFRDEVKDGLKSLKYAIVEGA